MIIFDEKRYAEKMLKQGYLTKKQNVYELNILARYYFSQKKSIEEVKKCLIEFCKKYDKYFDMDEWYKIINKTLAFAQKGRLVTGKFVTITVSELEKIKALETLNEQKVGFVLLVLYKFYGCKKFEISTEDLYRLCKLNLNSKSKLQILHSLTEKEMIDITMGGLRWVKFAEKIGEVAITIRNFDDFIYEYLKWIGEKISNCESCDKAIKITGNRKKYCRECWKEARKERNRENFRRWYDNQKSNHLENPTNH